MLFDYSKTNIDAASPRLLLVTLAEASGVADKRDGDVRGREDQRDRRPRGAAHRAAQPATTRSIMVDGTDVHARGARASAARMAAFAARRAVGARSRGRAAQITDVVNIGIGGSDLGPAMATLALAPYARRAARAISSRTSTARISMTCCGA